MRLDPDSSHSNGTRKQSNGSSCSPVQKPIHANSTNGHSSPNGHTSPVRNGSSTRTKLARSNNFFGHDRQEVTRLLIQGLEDLGYYDAAESLSQESGLKVETPSVAAFRHAVLEGEWAEAEALLFGLNRTEDGGGVSISNGDSPHHEGLEFSKNANKNELKFRMREQKYLELLEERDLGGALQVLRHELTPLNQDTTKLHELSSLIVCPSAEELKAQARWDGASGASRHDLLEDLSKSISPSVMIPEHRLAVLLNQVKQYQIANCTYHNPDQLPTLFADHSCDRHQFPLHTVLELGSNNGEVWSLQFSHNGKMLAASGEGNMIVIYDLTTYQPKHIFRDHSSHVPYLTWSPDDTKLISCSHDHKAKVWDIDSGHCILTIDHHTQPVTTAAWAPNSTDFVTGSLDKSTQLPLWTVRGGKLYIWPTDYRIQDCAITPNGQRVVTISSNGEIFVYNYVTREQMYCVKLGTKMTCISVSRDSKSMLVNLANGEVQLFNIETGRLVKRYMGQKQKSFVIRSSFGGSDDNIIISGSEDARVYLWHRASSEVIETLEGHQNGCVNAVAWNPADPGMFASAGDDRKVRIWGKAPTPEHQRSFQQRPQRSGRASAYEGSAAIL